MKKIKYKILVLSDLKASASLTIKNTLEFAKMLDGDVELFHVKSAAEIVERESQLSAVRNINEQYRVADKKIKKLLEPISKDNNLKVKYKYAFGNVKDEIKKHINQVKPDIIVLGKRKLKALNFIGDKITDYVLKKHKGAILITSDQNDLNLSEGLKLGVLNGVENSLDTSLGHDLFEKTNTPLKSFKIGSRASVQNQKDISSNMKTVEYVFEDNSNVIKALTSYVSKSNINLLCLDRNNSNSNTVNYTKDVINRINVSLLLT
jgi:nucleotide-binding universal stress UspA family protein